jgi:hypothetical protein
MKPRQKFAAICLWLLLATPVLIVWLANDNYYPAFEKVQVGMSYEEVAACLPGIFIKRSIRPNGIVNWYFQEPDVFTAYFFNIQFRDGRVVSKDSDL